MYKVDYGGYCTSSVSHCVVGIEAQQSLMAIALSTAQMVVDTERWYWEKLAVNNKESA